ncbi:MAG: FtsW/RodA/SpoVE family cell cycle protein, partial [Chloroflexota bacterium]
MTTLSNLWRTERPLTTSGRLERALLVIGGAFMAINLLALALTRGFRAGDWILLVVWVMCAVGGVKILEKYLPHRDPVFFALPMVLTGWGLVVIDRLSDGYIYNFADRQALWLVISTAVMLVIAARPEPLRWLREYRYLILLFGLILLISTILFGTNPTGDRFAPQLWLGFRWLFFQPSELLKIILVAFLASYLAEQYPALRAEGLNTGRGGVLALSPRILGPIVLMWGLAVVLLIWQRDLGTATIFFGVFLILLYVASSNLTVLIGGGVLLLIAAIAGYNLFSVVQLRVDIWLDPWAQADGRGYQIVQSLLAFAAGGVFGQGIGQGAPTYIPVVHSDFVFAAIAEEWGLLGVFVILSCLLAIIMRGMRVAVLQQERPFKALLAVGLCALLAIQALLITGGSLRVLPLTGVTLPFISYGGSSLLASYMMMGLLLRLSEGSGAK